ncbi:MAG: hypothetical protein V8S74_07530 [Lachnospirales bacterium]
MDNKILPPDNFNDLVMNKIKNENISPSFSIYGVVFAVCSGFFAFIMAIDFNAEYFNELFSHLGFYSVLGKYYYAVVDLEDYISNIDFNNLIPAFIMALGVYIVFYNLLFGVKKNG